MSIDDLTHLTPWAAKIALLPNPDRVQRIRTDRWVGYTKAEEALLKLNTLITHPKRQRMPNLLIIGPTNKREFLNLIRFLGNQLQIPIVCVGTKEAYFAIRSDDQLENRFEPVTLPLWKDDAEFASLLASLAATLPLRKPSILTSAEVMHFILDKSEGTIGEIITLITKAALIAIQLT
jgi:hypothetical protein